LTHLWDIRIGHLANELAGGIVYDALIAACARKAGASVLYTCNPRDFQRLLREGGPAISTPANR
jgi:predicted nucleic acid-binding protein